MYTKEKKALIYNYDRLILMLNLCEFYVFIDICKFTEDGQIVKRLNNL